MNRRLPSIIALILTAGAAGLLTGTASHAAQAALGCPGTVPTGAQLATEITVDVGTIPLGAYSLTVTYDPTVLTIASVAGGNRPEFAGAPTTNPGSFTSGRTNIAAFQTSSLTGPTGVVSVTRVRFNVVGTTATTTSVGLTVGNLFDTNSNPIAHTATGCMVMVTDGSPTTTSSTSTTTVPSSTTTSTLAAPPCTSDDECADDDACTVDVCDPARGCVSTSPAGTDGLTCLLGQLGAGDVCGPGEIDAGTSSLIAKRVARAEALLVKANRASRPASRAAAFRKIGRTLRAILRRLGKDSATVSAPCAGNLERLVGDVQNLALKLAS
jgi:hypothetical protein